MDGLTVPEKRDFYVSEATKQKLIVMAKLAEKSPQNCLIRGMQGCGKSELPAQFANRLGRPFFGVEIGLYSEAAQWMGQYQLVDGKTVYQTFGLLNAIQVEKCVIRLDEFNREETPKAKNALFSILDDRRAIWVDELQQWITVAQGVIFFATINEGAEFTGTEMLDIALGDRFFTVEVGNLPRETEQELLVKRTGMTVQQANELGNILQSVRNSEIKVSTRKAIQVGELVCAGLGVKDSFEFALGMDKDQLEKILLSIHFGREDELDKSEEKWTVL